MVAKKGKAGSAVAAVSLAAVVAATQNPAQGYIFATPAEVEKLVAAGLVEQNPGLANPDNSGGLATRATQKGIEQANASKAPAGASGAPPAWGGGQANQPVTDSDTLTASDVGKVNVGKPSFEIETGIVVPKVSGRGRTGESIYPFDKLEIGQSFFVDKEAKNLASTISGANARHSEVVTDEAGNPVMRKNKKGAEVEATRQLRKFIVRNAEKPKIGADGKPEMQNGKPVMIKGARIWRVAVDTAEDTAEATA